METTFTFDIFLENKKLKERIAELEKEKPERQQNYNEGRPIHVIGMSEDITERKRTEEKLAFQASLLEQVH